MSTSFVPIFIVGMILITTLPVFFIIRRVFGGMKRQAAEHQRLLQVGIPAPAQIQSVQMGGMTMTTGVHRHLQLVITVNVQASGRPPYMAQLTTMVSELQVPQLQPGAMVQVRIDPANPAKLALEAVGQPGMHNPGMHNPGMPNPGMPNPGMHNPGMHNPAMAAVPRMQYGAGGPAAPAGMTPVQPVQMPAGARVGLFIGIAGVLVALGVGVAVSLTFAGGSSSSDLPPVPVPTPNGSSVCAKAVACCETISPDSAEHCKNMSMPGVTDAVCQSSLEGFRRAAEAQGKTCE